MSTDPERKLSGELLTAIGRVATASATLEAQVRFAVGDLAGGIGGEGWIIFEGQSMDWLILNGIAVLGEYNLEYGGYTSAFRNSIEQMKKCLRDVEKVKSERNTIIHGEWSSSCVTGWEPGDCLPHSTETTDAPAETIFHVVRSRYRRGYQEQQWSVAEVNKLAEEIRILTGRIRNARKKVNEIQMYTFSTTGNAGGGSTA
ncbi:hypothetical protein [Nocardia terpenica]|uniref:Uncharacterized protein n=1 Tax=Nocardia terpenica TaxID=455432 RepID=A0A6G9Z2Z2_9NOCA|nr:hypothetical protein [Nocardia terpenica]QIS19556.1 hypothetical protein F6W96_15960 [Nocardia terpenica]